MKEDYCPQCKAGEEWASVWDTIEDYVGMVNTYTCDQCHYSWRVEEFPDSAGA